MLRIAIGIAALAMLVASSAVAQVEYDTTQLQQRADVERNRILLRSTMRKKAEWDASHGRARGTPAQGAACSDRPRFRREYGVANPKVQRLERLCAQAGY